MYSVFICMQFGPALGHLTETIEDVSHDINSNLPNPVVTMVTV